MLGGLCCINLKCLSIFIITCRTLGYGLSYFYGFMYSMIYVCQKNLHCFLQLFSLVVVLVLETCLLYTTRCPLGCFQLPNKSALIKNKLNPCPLIIYQFIKKHFIIFLCNVYITIKKICFQQYYIFIYLVILFCNNFSQTNLNYLNT